MSADRGPSYGYILPLAKRFGGFSFFNLARKWRQVTPQERERHAKLVEVYIFFRICLGMAWAFGLAAIVGRTNEATWLFLAGMLVPALHIWDVAQANFVRHVFEAEYDHDRGQPASASRAVVIAIINYIELIFAFASIYLACLKLPGHGLTGNPKPTGYWDCAYFSGVTQLTIGYGDLHPLGASRAIAVMQALLGFALSLFIFGRLVSLLHDRTMIEKADGTECPDVATGAGAHPPADKHHAG